ncbi:pantetheine-phosphate adenylyltransferase [bacterium]|nr:MAG: pantetheine-phosphate adenylyltransferase [bacterium]
MRVAVYSGTFDPVTLGHLDLVSRATRHVDSVVVAIGISPREKPLFSLEDRLYMLQEATAHYRGVSIDHYEGLLAAYARRIKATAIIRGLRAVSDFEYELQMALANRKLFHEAETIFLMPSEKFTYLNSTLVKDILLSGGEISSFVPPVVIEVAKKRGLI